MFLQKIRIRNLKAPLAVQFTALIVLALLGFAIAAVLGWVVFDDNEAVSAEREYLAFTLFLVIAATLVSVAILPLVRAITKSLERLNSEIDQIGVDYIGSRVTVGGPAEVASVAESFNKAIAQIETAQQAQRLWLAHASHELRTPLTRIVLGIEGIEAGIGDDTSTALRRDLSDLEDLIESLLLSSRLEAMSASQTDNAKLESLELSALVVEEASRYDDVIVEVEGLGSIVGDTLLLKRLTRNLLNNAVIHGKGPVSVRVVERVASAEGSSEVLLGVRDHGDGIPAGLAEMATKPFYRLPQSQSKPGSGLGLSIIQQIVDLHGGRLSFEMQTGSFTVWITLPSAI